MKRLITFIIISIGFGACKPYENVPELTYMSDLQYPYEEVKTVTIDSGIDLAYIDEGQGKETIIFIHGLGSYMPAWYRNIQELKNDYRCIALDLPGYGKSEKGDYRSDMMFFANTVKSLLQELNIDKATVAGHSMGGQIAMTIALHYPELVEKLILVSPAGFETFTEGQKQWFREIVTPKLTQLTTVEMIQANLAYNFYAMPAEAEFMITDRMAIRKAVDFEWYALAITRSVQGMVDQPVFEFLPEIEQPVLSVFGENDNLIPNRFLNPGFTKEVALKGDSQLPNSILNMIPKAGHFVHFEKPEEFNQAVKSFLK